MTSATDAHERSGVTVHGRRMAYAYAGQGPPIRFLHGNPTYSYIWRNIMPTVDHLGHCVAPDLIGMGDSDKLSDSGPGRYRYAEHEAYLFGLLEALDPGEPAVLVLHDWGAALGLAWARQNPDKVRGIAFMEPVLMPLTWDGFPPSAVDAFKGMRSAEGERMCLEENFFVEQILPMAVMRELSAGEMAAYRRPFAEPGEGRRPTLTWPREIPIEGEPADVARTLEANVAWLEATDIPKLFIAGDPGLIATGPVAERCRNFPNTREVTVPGLHYLQEDSPETIGATLSEWITNL